MHDEHPFGRQLREDYQRLAYEYLHRYSEPALWFAGSMELPKRIVDASSSLEPNRLGEPSVIRVLALLPEEYHILRYGMTPEGTGLCFTTEQLRVDDILVLPQRLFPRDTWAKPKEVDAARKEIVFAVPSFYPLRGEWEQGRLVFHAPRMLRGAYEQSVNMGERYYLRYEYAYTLRVKSIGTSWRVSDMEDVVFSYHVSVQDE